jgi:hypothetical protein
MRLIGFATFLALLFGGVQPVAALCSGAGLEREYREADVVVRARVSAETRVHDDRPGPAAQARWGEYFPVSLHRLEVLETFKGAPGPTVELFQQITSGAFPLDLGGEYLLFLHYHRPAPGLGSAARGAVYVRHTCGQSKTWAAVSRANLASVHMLAREQQAPAKGEARWRRPN